ncbi:carbohydrate ABC transporter permease [Phytoactinopolyspora halotolerans]|uniref:Sugar ABC transporter permease n=1 Tax=Phytoactinopolyspora halotolerans TaxID=1981512 RepID=A0A6L9SC04_9ACTN|nr:sugar ABC transporter permease [Phytoactinopolyspora halotolerans]NEE01550.1 sugar ABC transporter permease [Phytoactinopolyspora halotolerans]
MAPITPAGSDVSSGPPPENDGHVTAAAERPRRPRLRGRLGTQHLAGWLFSTPFLLLFGTFMAFPIVASLLMSFTDFGLRNVTDPLAADFVGLDNYIELFGDETFRRALFNTTYFVVVGVPLTIGLGLVAAVLLNSGIDRFRTFFRVGFYTPVVTSIVAVAVVWRFVLEPRDGLIAGVAAEFGWTSPDFLSSPTLAMPSLIAMAVWRNLGFPMVLFLAGLQSIPTEVREASRIDGAGAVQEFRKVTVPLLRPTMLYVAVITTIGYLNVFEEPFVMTGGGPADSTLTTSLYMYREGFDFFHMGYASAMAYTLFVIVLAITLLQLRFLRDKTR